MSTKSENITIDKLRAALNTLHEHTLPRKTRAALQAVFESLDTLSQKLEESEEQSRLAALYRVSQMLGTSLNLDEVLNQVMDAVIELTGAERGFLVLRTPDLSELVLRAARNFERETLSADNMKISRTVIDTVLETGQGVVTTNAQEDPRFARQESVITFALRSILCAPLCSRGNTIGVIYVDNRGYVGLFSSEELSLLNTFATQAAVTIENARLYTLTDQTLAARVGELEILTQIDRELTDQLDLDHVLAITQTWATRETGAKNVWIALFGPENTILSVVTGSDAGKILDPDDPIIQSLGRTTPTSLPTDENTHTRLAIPLHAARQPLGVLVVESPNPLPDTAQEFLTRLAARAASAAENARLYQAIQDANQAKSKFISVVSHELRLPMTSIKGYADLLLQGVVGPVNDQQKDFLDVIRSNVERMRVLVSDLSDTSRIETGRLRLVPVLIPLHGYVEQALESLRPKITEKNQTLEVDVFEDLPRCFADPNRVRQVLDNLINNAWKYTPEGGHIAIKSRQKGNFIYTEITDNGIGISPEDQARLFTQFFRSEDSAVREQTGWGLGLHVAKQLVELMGGEIGMRSKLGEGSTFWFALPTSEEG